MIVHRLESPQALAVAVAARFVTDAREAIRTRGVFRVALSGGSTPRLIYQTLRAAYLAWSRVEFYWSDERFVPASDAASNEGMARAVLLNAIGAPNVFPMVSAPGAAECADRYEALLPGALDLVLLGLGADGHTASLFPGEPSVHERERKAIAANAPVAPYQRITLSAPYINRAGAVWFLVAGSDKRDALTRTLHGPENHDLTPAQAIARHAPHAELFADLAALS